jgi:hypothetical protein
VQADALDEPVDVGAGAVEAQAALAQAQVAGEDREVDDQARVRPAEVREVDDDVARPVLGAGDRVAPATLGQLVLLAAAAKGGRGVGVVDDGPERGGRGSRREATARAGLDSRA